MIMAKQAHPLGLYLHIPFCRSKCAYCDFYSLSGREDRMDAYTAALERHLIEVAPQAAQHSVDTVYFGGGTPSYLGEKRLAKLLKAVKKHYHVDPHAEITLEANPDSAGDWKALRALRRAGFNRISLGVQSTDDACLRALGRIHTWQQVQEAVAACRARAEEAFSKLNGSADPAHDFAVLAATYSDETDRDQHPSGYTFTVGDGTLPAACEEAAQALEEGQFSGVVEADDGFYLILRKPVDLEAVAPDYFDALLQAAADSADISTTRTYADLDVSRFYDELIAARAELDASGGEVA